jgi:hypothetical protein
MNPTCLAALALASIVSASIVRAQELPDPRADPTGTVGDEEGKPIAGARVSLRWVVNARDPLRSTEFEAAVGQVVRAYPLPGCVSGPDGGFVLPLMRDQKRLGWDDGQLFVLVVAKPGYQRWCECLPLGLRGYLGSRVVLRALRDADRLRFSVRDPRPGMTLRVVRTVDAARYGGDGDEGETVPVPASGVVDVTFPLVPCPPTFTPSLDGSGLSWLGLRAAVELGGVAGKSICVDPAAVNEIAFGEPRAARGPAEPRPPECVRLEVKVEDARGRPVVGAGVRLTGSCAAPGTFDGRPPVTDAAGVVAIARVARGGHRMLVLAEGFAARYVPFETAAEEVTRLRAVLEESEPLRVRIVAGAGKPCAFARGSLSLMDQDRVALSRQFQADSEGRTVLWTGVPLGGAALVGSMQGSDQGPQDLKLEPGGRATLTLAEPPGPRCLVRIATGSGVVCGYRCRTGMPTVADYGSRDEGSPAPALALVLPEWAPSDEQWLFLLSGSPPVSIKAPDLARALRERPGLACLDRRAPVRSIALHALVGDGEAVPRLWVQPADLPQPFPPKALAAGNLAVRHEDGSWWLHLFDDGAADLIVTRGGRDPRPLHVPARGAGDRAEPALTIDLR